MIQIDRCCVISLKRRKDRLDKFNEAWKAVEWPFSAPIEVVPAVDGKCIPLPYQHGAGALGCNLSHRHIIQQALSDKINTVLILEDDAFPIPGFTEKLELFWKHVPEDWQAIFLGGQNVGPPKAINAHVAKSMNAQRTHAILWKCDTLMKEWYKEMSSQQRHIDHVLGPMCRKYNVYQPHPIFLVGQNDTPSDILCGAKMNKRLWSSLPEGSPVVFLDAPRAVRDALADRLHYGHTIKDGIDAGIADAFRQRQPEIKLKHWIKSWGAEGLCEGKIVAIWHPEATLEVVQKAIPGVLHVQAKTPEEARHKLDFEEVQERPIILLRADKQTVAGLRHRGWHTGNWRDPISDVDNGLRAMFADKHDEELVAAMADWISLVGSEVRPEGYLVVWHADCTKELLSKATTRPIIEVTGTTVEDCVKQLDASCDNRKASSAA